MAIESTSEITPTFWEITVESQKQIFRNVELISTALYI